MSSNYESPTVSEVGSLADLTAFNLNKNPGSADTVTIGGQTISVPGSGPA